jgi:hypothetical protein
MAEITENKTGVITQNVEIELLLSTMLPTTNPQNQATDSLLIITKEEIATHTNTDRSV